MRWLFFALCIALIVHVSIGCASTPSAPLPDPGATATVPDPPATSPTPDVPIRRMLSDESVVTRIAFGSCAGEDAPQPIWNVIRATDPDLFLFIGDNVYADTDEREVMRQAYAQLDTVQGFRRLREEAVVLATWDDHDYGKNDGGVEFEGKQMAQEEFIRFYDLPAASRVRSGEGVYDAYTYGPPGRRVQVILLDTRYFRGPLTRKPDGSDLPGRYVPTSDTTVTMLGAAQWAWLETQFRQPADLRIVASSIQFASREHGWEGWGLMPHEARRMLRLIDAAGAHGVVFVSGDRHLADLSVMPPRATGLSYPLYDLTSSSLNRPSGNTYDEPNQFRVEGPYMPINFGLITVDWERGTLRFEIRDGDGVPVLNARTTLAALR